MNLIWDTAKNTTTELYVRNMTIHYP